MAQQSALGVGGTPAQVPGSFTGKGDVSGPHPVGKITRLGVSGITRPRLGSFAGKGGAGPHPVDRITRLGISGIPRPQYNTFSGKAAAGEDTEENLGGSTWLASQAKRDRLLRDDEDIISLVMAMVTSGKLDG